MSGANDPATRHPDPAGCRTGRIILFLSAALALSPALRAQDVPYHVGNETVYRFLDELANTGAIDINPAVRPYSRKFIAGKLKEASGRTDILTPGQLRQTEFYLRDFNKELMPGKGGWRKRPDLFYYKDSLFTLSVNPIAGYQYWKNGHDGFYHRRIGADAFACIGPHVALYASLRDNTESDFLSLPGYLTPRPAAVYKHGPNDRGGDFSEARGGITYSWTWGNVGLVKDHFVWGSAYHGSNIFAGRTPSFPFIKLHMQPVSWFEFNYLHGFLVSDILDTNRSYASGIKTRSVFVPKFLAANIYTFTLLRGLKASVGNSIVYADEFQLAYLVPVYFFKSVDHTTTNTSGNYTGQNAQMFFDLNSRQIRYLNLYVSVFIDEVNLGNFWKKDKQSNFFSVKAGVALSHPVVPNTTLVLEYTASRPGAYKHFVSTTTYASNDFNLGHYLRDNADEYHAAVRWRPLTGLYLEAAATLAEKGEDYPYLGTGGSGLGLPFLDRVLWRSRQVAFSAEYEIINDGFVFAGFEYRRMTGADSLQEQYAPAVYRGETSTVTAGLRFGF